MSKKIGNPEINSNNAEPSFDTNNQNNHDFKESTNLSFDESNNQILLYALATESGDTKIVTIPL
jgi:hypothetical protein